MISVERAAKLIANQREHGCNFAEGTCAECEALANGWLWGIEAAKAALRLVAGASIEVSEHKSVYVPVEVAEALLDVFEAAEP